MRYLNLLGNLTLRLVTIRGANILPKDSIVVVVVVKIRF